MLRKLWKRTIIAAVVVLVVVTVKLWEVGNEDTWRRRQLKPVLIRYLHGVLSRHRTLYPEKSQWMLKEQTGSSTLYSSATEPQSYQFSRDRGYVLAMDYWGQQTCASHNLQNLQCWAAQLNLSVVEPVMVGSQLKSPLSTHSNSKGFWFREVFNIEMWNNLSSRVGHSILVPWDSFVRDAPRNVILVSFKYASEEVVENRLNKPPLPPSEMVKQDCGSNKWSSTPAFQQFFRRHQFQVVQRVCASTCAFGNKISRHNFTSHLYGNQPPNKKHCDLPKLEGDLASYV